MKLNRRDISDQLAERNGLTKRQSTALVVDLFNIIKEEMANGNDVRIHQFGTFTHHTRAARTGRNLMTGELIDIPTVVVPKFRPARALKTLIRDSIDAKDE